MRITDFDVVAVGNPWKNWLLFRLGTDTGLTGVGEGTLNGFHQSVTTVLHELRDLFVGQDPHNLKAIRHQMLTQRYSDGGQIHRAAVAAVEVACWDLLGKEARQPVYNLWGGRMRDKIRLYANGWYRTERDPDAVVERARAAVALGYTALKIDPFGDAYGQLPRSEWELSLSILRALRKALPEVDLLVEGHCRFDLPTALALARELAEVDVKWFEEPLTYQNLPALAEVARRSTVVIATGENFTSYLQFLELAQLNPNFVFQPDVLNLGGLSEARRVCELGEALQIPVAPHDAQGPVSKACCLQLGAYSPAVIIQEDFEEFNDEWTRELSSPVQKAHGYATIPTAPGLGREVYLDKAAEHPTESDGFLSLFEPGWELRAPHRGG